MIAVLAIGWSWPGKTSEPRPEEPVKETEAAPEQNSGGSLQQKVLSFNLEGFSEKGEKKWEVNGKSAEVVSESEIRMNDIVARTYSKEAEATITGEKGVYDKVKNNVKLENNVKATIEATQGAIGDYADFSGPVAGSPDAKKHKAKETKKTKTVITCDAEVFFDYEKNLAYFNKNVRVVSEEGSITADRITINLDPATKKIKDIIAEGNVRIQRGENITYSEKATYIEAEKKVILTGSPRLVIYEESPLKGSLLGQK